MHKAQIFRPRRSGDVRSEMLAEKGGQRVVLGEEVTLRPRAAKEFPDNCADFGRVQLSFQKSRRHRRKSAHSDYYAPFFSVLLNLLTGRNRQTLDSRQNENGVRDSDRFDGLGIDEIEMQARGQDLRKHIRAEAPLHTTAAQAAPC